MLEILRSHQLYAKVSKCTFMAEEVEYLGHIVSKDGIQVDPAKVKCIREWPQPQNITQLGGFLSLASFYKRFIKHFSRRAAPLTDLLKKDAFKWSEEAQLSFEDLKNALSIAPMLACSDFTMPFIVETDASGKGLGAVLRQEHGVIAFESRKFDAKEMNPHCP